MTLNLTMPDTRQELKPRITVFGVGGAGGNAVNNMIDQSLEGCEFVVANTDAQALAQSKAPGRIQMGARVTEGLGAGARPAVGASAAEESIEEIVDHLAGAHMAFITAGMGGGTGTGAAPIIAQAARELGVLTVGVVTKPFQFEGGKRMRQADEGIEALQKVVDTLIIIPNQNLFRLANEKTTFTEAFAMADDVLYQGVKGVTDLMVRPGLINLDFADVRAVMNEMGKAMMGTGEADGDTRALQAAEKAIANPLLDEISLKGARGVLINITGGYDLTLFELDEAANRIREEVDPDANIIVGSTLDEKMEGKMRVSVVATGIDVSAEASEPHRDIYGAAALRNRSRTGEAVDEQPAAASAPAPAPAPAPERGRASEAPEPSLFETFADEASPDDLFEPEQASDAVPPPAYRPVPQAPVRPVPAASASQERGPAREEHGERAFVAPKAGGSPTPEALSRLRDAIQRETPRAEAQAHQPRTQGEQPQQHGKARFGINNLINRMTGHADEGTSPVTRRTPSFSGQPPQSHIPARDDDTAVDPDQERIEIPAFLRRQAN
ncbi:cell division protein FtsZ [Roseibacterium sp. SDUM158017]|uniref:cell division protein FtsZ n=1 Tax=Roseicyclus salinarum TaxID=3036773 RepID=UPI002414F225|nr:cell division protein FtsZ [Roseibacterium sp. SDUM158017]MDG4647680.1 cell division protein FtsZ [Roseibacterium sp. SDUM158017]